MGYPCIHLGPGQCTLVAHAKSNSSVTSIQAACRPCDIHPEGLSATRQCPRKLFHQHTGSLPTQSFPSFIIRSATGQDQRMWSPLQGTLVSETRCLACNTVTTREEAFYDLSLDIEQNCSLTACLQNFRCLSRLNQHVCSIL